jgi:hypothetical protein
LGGQITGGLGIDVDDVAIRCFKFEVGSLEFVETLREKAGADEKHKRERGLQDDQRSLQQ